MDLKGMVVGAHKGASLGSEYEKAKKHLQVIPDNTNNSRLKLLLAGRIDVA